MCHLRCKDYAKNINNDFLSVFLVAFLTENACGLIIILC